MNNYKKIEKLMGRGSKFLGSEYAIIGGAMTWISEANLVASMSNAGIFGVLASGAMDGEILKKEIISTKQKTQKSFGVNLILMNPKLHELIDVCSEEKISHIVLAGGIPDKNLMNTIHSHDMKILSFASSLSIAKRMISHGLDGLILEGSEAGGHVGPVSTMILIQDILLNLCDQGLPIFIAGGILRGEIVASMIQLGAVGCQLGTAFACCAESRAHPDFKNAFFKANGRNAVTPAQLDKKFPIAPVRALENIGTQEFMIKQKEIIAKCERGELSNSEGRLALEHFWAGSLRRAVLDGDIERGSLMSGQIIELIKDEKTISEVVDTLLQEAENFLSKGVGS